MENKKYLDKVIGSLVRGTKIDYINKRFSFPFFFTSSVPFSFLPPSSFLRHPVSFSEYCKRFYGLTEDEIKYVWNEYREIIKDKISKREP